MVISEPKERTIRLIHQVRNHRLEPTGEVVIIYRTLDGWEFSKVFKNTDELGAMAKLAKHFASLDRRNERRRERSCSTTSIDAP